MCAVYISVWCLATLREPNLQRHVAEAMSSQQVPGSGPRRSPADADGTYDNSYSVDNIYSFSKYSPLR